MGSWFIEYLLTKKNFQIKAYDKNIDSIGKRLNLKIESDFNSCVKDSDIVVLCVPLRIIPKMIIECSKIMKRNSVLVDISSIKNKSFQSLLKIQDYILPICIHPMFRSSPTPAARTIRTAALRTGSPPLPAAGSAISRVAAAALRRPGST